MATGDQTNFNTNLFDQLSHISLVRRPSLFLGFQVHILEITICEPVESIQDPLLFVYIFKAFQLAPTIWTFFLGRDKSSIPVSA